MLCVLNTAHIVHWMWLPRISFVVLYVNLFEFIAHLLFTTALYFFANVHVLRIPWGNAKFYVYFCRCVLMCRIRCTIFHNFRFFFLFIPKNGKEMAAVCSMLLLTGRLADRKYITWSLPSLVTFSTASSSRHSVQHHFAV